MFFGNTPTIVQQRYHSDSQSFELALAFLFKYIEVLNECAHFQSVILLVANFVIYGWNRVEGACYDSPLNLNDIKARSNKDSKNGYAPDHQQQTHQIKTKK